MSIIYFQIFQTYIVFISDLSNMYVLLKPIHNGLNYLIDQVESYIRETGLNAVQDLKGDNVSNTLLQTY